MVYIHVLPHVADGLPAVCSLCQDKEADQPQLSAAELKEELRRHNVQAAKEAAERKKRREAAAARKKQTAAQRAKEAAARASSAKSAPPPQVTEALAAAAEEELAEAEAAPVERAQDAKAARAAMPAPPKFRPPRKAPKGVMGQAKKFHKDYPMAVWVVVAVAVLATLLHFLLR